MKTVYRNEASYAFRNIYKYPITYITAPIGYGKTTAILDFFKEQKEVDIAYFSTLMESDEQWVWSKTMKEMGKFLHLPIWTQYFSDEEEFMEGCASEIEFNLQRTTVLVLDDCEWDKQANLMRTWIKIALQKVENFHLVMVSREATSTMLMEATVKGTCKCLDAEIFLFQKEEIKKLAIQNKIVLPSHVMEQIYTLSNGWPSAISAMLSNYEDYGRLDTQNVENMIERVIFGKLEKQIRNDLMKLSVLKDFSYEQAADLTYDRKGCREIKKMAEEQFFMRKQEERIIISPIFKSILFQHLQMSSINQKRLFEHSGEWAEKEKNYMQAIYYYDQGEAYERIVGLLEQVKDENFIDQVPVMMDQIYDRIPLILLQHHPYAWLRIISETCTDIQPVKGMAKLAEFEAALVQHKLQGEIEQLTGEVELIKGIMSFNDIYEMSRYFQKAYQHIYPAKSKVTNAKMILNFESPHSLYLYHKEPGKLHEVTQFIVDHQYYFSTIASSLNMGLKESALAEEAFETGKIKLAHKYAWQGIQVASAYAMDYLEATCYFVLCRCALYEHDLDALQRYMAVLTRMKQESISPILSGEIDCIQFYIYARRKEWNLIPPWLLNGDLTSSKLLDRNVYQYIVYGQILLRKKEFKRLEQLSYHMEAVYEEPYHVFGMIYTYLYRFIALSQLQENDEDAFQSLQALCQPDGIIMPISEEALAVQAMKRKKSNEWIALVLSFEQVNLNNVEESILFYFMQNYKRKEIADALGIPEDALNYRVKKLFQSYQVSSKKELLEKIRK